MKKIILTIVLMSLLFVSSSFATQINITRYSGYFSGSGGEFNISNYDSEVTNNYVAGKTLIKGGFESFCLEAHESVTIPGVYNAVLNSEYKAIQGGNGSTTGFDVISVGTAYLYSLFATGNLIGYDYTVGTGRVASAKALQEAIWSLEDETGGNISAYQALLISKFGSLANAKMDVTSANNYGVSVLNLYTAGGALAQDQLVLVPEPSIMLLLGLGLIGVGVLRRKS